MAQAKQQQAITVAMNQSKVTKGTVRFDAPEDNAVLTNVYIRKEAWPDGQYPAAINVSVTPA